MAGAPGAYGQPPYGPPGTVPQTNGKAIASLILSIAGFVVCLVGSILGIVFGSQAKREIRESAGAQTGEGMAQAGQIIGWIGVGLSVLLVVALVGVTFLGKAASVKFSSIGTGTDQCIDNPNAYGC